MAAHNAGIAAYLTSRPGFPNRLFTVHSKHYRIICPVFVSHFVMLILGSIKRLPVETKSDPTGESQ